MKRFFIWSCVMSLFIVSSSMVYAGSIDWLSQQSAEYIRVLSRNATLDGADMVNYNPAGTAFLEDGAYLQISSYSLLKDYDMEYAGTTYSSNEPSPAVPNIYGIYKMDKLAFFGAFTVPAGGGSVDYSDGLPYMKQNEFAVAAVNGLDQSYVKWKSGSLEASSIYLAGTIGASYAINDMYSVSLAARYISAKKEYDGEAIYTIVGTDYPLELDATREATGFSGIIGFDAKISEKLNIGLRYELATPLEWETDTEKNDFQLTHYSDGDKEDIDLPAVLGLGFSYQVMPELNWSVSAHYFFITNSDSEDDTTNALGQTVVNSYDDDYDNGYELTTGLEYQLNEAWLLSVGYQWTDTGANEDTFRDFDFTLDSHFFGGGFRWSAFEQTDITFGVGRVIYLEGEAANTETFYNKAVWAFSLGADFRF